MGELVTFMEFLQKSPIFTADWHLFVYREAFRWHLPRCSWWGHNVDSTEACDELWTVCLVLLFPQVCLLTLKKIKPTAKDSSTLSVLPWLLPNEPSGGAHV
ncbi:rCG35176 [Rattus norvegicus]|uniref:RCG35176 n=1 Tax=Rattus norvegicus TaxID=10116 RepID=A6HG98_RAT|nr:rCG35176 [Rattus norvegicus]